MRSDVDCSHVKSPRLFLYPKFPQPWKVWDGRLTPLLGRIEDSEHFTTDGECADYFLVHNQQLPGDRRSSTRVADGFRWLARTWPYWNRTARQGLARHLLLMPCDHGPGDCMYDRLFMLPKPKPSKPRRRRRRGDTSPDPPSPPSPPSPPPLEPLGELWATARAVPDAVNPESPRRMVAFINENGAPGYYNFFIRGLDIRLPSGELHDCGPFCGTSQMQRPASGQRRRSVAQAVLAEHSPWLPSRSEAEREALLKAPRRYQLFWAGRASGKKGFRGDLFRFHTDAADKLRDGWLLHDTSHKHTPLGAATAAEVKQRGWFARSMTQADFCYSPPGQYHGDSDRYLPAVLYGCIPIFAKDGEARPFDEVIPWEQISLHIGLIDVGNLHTILANVSQERRLRMRRALGNVWQQLLWTGTFSKLECTAGSRPCRRRASSAVPRYLGEDERQDAFATFVQILSRRLLAERAGGCRKLASDMVEYCI